MQERWTDYHCFHCSEIFEKRKLFKGHLADVCRVTAGVAASCPCGAGRGVTTCAATGDGGVTGGISSLLL